MPSGSQTSGDTSAIVPVNPRGVTPTIVKSIPLIFIVLPTKFGSKSRARHLSNDATATGIAARGRSSSIRKPRPAAIGTRSVSK